MRSKHVDCWEPGRRQEGVDLSVSREESTRTKVMMSIYLISLMVIGLVALTPQDGLGLLDLSPFHQTFGFVK